jgi:hypothetical protein
MINIIPKVPSAGERLGAAIGGGLGQGFQQGMTRAQEFAQQMQLAEAKKKQEDTQKFATGLETIQRMRSIIEKGNVGRGSSFLGFFPGETQRDRGELEQLGKSLIPLVAAGVPVRNRKEFEEYKKTITNPSSPDDEFLGALDGLERIFEGKINEKGSSKQAKGKVQFNIKNPEHKAKRDQLMKKFNNDREKVEEILNREFE